MRPAALSTAGILSLITLVLQNAAVALITRQSRMGTAPGAQYHTSTVILNQEIVKMFFCLGYFAYERKCHSLAHYWQSLSQAVAQPDTVKLAVPALLFTVQNFLIFLSLANLDVMTFQMLSQTKLLSAALFSVWLLNRRLNNAQWVSLLILTLGVILAHVDTKGAAFVAKAFPPFGRMFATTTAIARHDGHQHDGKNNNQHQAAGAGAGGDLTNFSWLGVIACIVSGLSSSFAGVYFEKVVKTSAPSLAVRNIHLSLFGIPFAILSMLVVDVRVEGRSFEYLRGYSAITWALVATHAVGGLLVAAVVKYADNIQKGFATAVATVLSGVYAALFWGFYPTMEFVLGCTAVFASVILFHRWESPKVPLSGDAAGGGSGGSGSGGGGGGGGDGGSSSDDGGAATTTTASLLAGASGHHGDSVPKIVVKQNAM